MVYALSAAICLIFMLNYKRIIENRVLKLRATENFGLEYELEATNKFKVVNKFRATDKLEVKDASKQTKSESYRCRACWK